MVIAIVATIALSPGGDDSGNDAVTGAEQADPQEEVVAADDVVQQEDAPAEQAGAIVPTTVSLQDAADRDLSVRLVSEESQELDTCLASDENEAPIMLPCPGDGSDLWNAYRYRPDASNPSFALFKDEVGGPELWLCLNENGDALVADCFDDDALLWIQVIDSGKFKFGPFNDPTLCAAHPPGGEGPLGVEPCSDEPRFHWALLPET